MEGVSFFSKCHTVLSTTSPKPYGNLKIKKYKTVRNSIRSFPNTVENKDQETNCLQKDLPYNQQCCSHSHFLRGINHIDFKHTYYSFLRGTQLILHTLNIRKGLGTQDIVNSSVFLPLQLSHYILQNAKAVGLTHSITTE